MPSCEASRNGSRGNGSRRSRTTSRKSTRRPAKWSRSRPERRTESSRGEAAGRDEGRKEVTYKTEGKGKTGWDPNRRDGMHSSRRGDLLPASLDKSQDSRSWIDGTQGLRGRGHQQLVRRRRRPEDLGRRGRRGRRQDGERALRPRGQRRGDSRREHGPRGSVEGGGRREDPPPSFGGRGPGLRRPRVGGGSGKGPPRLGVLGHRL